MTPISLRIRELRLAKGWSQSELALRANVTQGTVSRIENHLVTSIELVAFENLAKALNVHPAVLILEQDLPVTHRQNYKGFVIVAKTRQRVKSGKWTLAIQIERHTGSEIAFKAYSTRDTFGSREAAVKRCFVFGRHIIDGKVPRLTPP